jgi:hypothetical protein
LALAASGIPAASGLVLRFTRVFAMPTNVAAGFYSL